MPNVWATFLCKFTAKTITNQPNKITLAMTTLRSYSVPEWRRRQTKYPMWICEMIFLSLHHSCIALQQCIIQCTYSEDGFIFVFLFVHFLASKCQNLKFIFFCLRQVIQQIVGGLGHTKVGKSDPNVSRSKKRKMTIRELTFANRGKRK